PITVASTTTQTGKPAGHQWAVLMATSGKKHWPPMGRTQWPLTLGVEERVQASADARELAAQVRPLAINVNDLDRRARAGEPVALSAEVPELIELLHEVRALLGDRAAS
ncbi:hypothetical protein ACQCT1_00575, partial [Micrococcus luteus]|uniref:hypothetical protein n=1 Tax=Micrococcus luteus TaxID=1270 RepID=UPI003CF6AA41